MTREEAIRNLQFVRNNLNDSMKIAKAYDMAIKALKQEPKAVALLEKTYADFCECEGGEGWLEIDGKKYFTDVGYAMEGMSIFMEVFKQRLAESEVSNADSNRYTRRRL